MGGTTVDWLDERLGIRALLVRHPTSSARKNLSFFYCFGGLTFFFFALQVLTGMLLALYYVATPAEAHASVEYIQNEVSYGSLIRGMHRWGSSGMVLTIGVHMLRVFFTGSYKPPRELNWVVGVVLLAITLAFSFTGYLLPWDQKAYWATQVGMNIVGTVPVVGDPLLRLMRGGVELNGVSLARFYAVHTLALPAASVLFLVAHFVMIRRQGISGPL